MSSFLFNWQKDDLLCWILKAIALIAGAIIGFIILFLIVESEPALTNIGLSRFFTDPSWIPSPDPLVGKYNLLPILIGTLLSAFGAIVLATPLGIASAIFLNFYASPTYGKIYRRAIELMAGIPSVVYGFWGLVVLVPIIQGLKPPGQSLLAGILILSIMILPTIALLADSAFTSIPKSSLHAASALGLSRWTTLQTSVIPLAKSGLTTAVILAMGRAIGETMAILMVCGNIVKIPGNLFDPIRTLTSNIALEMAYAVGDHRSALFVSGLILTLLVMVLVFLAEIASRGKIRC